MTKKTSRRGAGLVLLGALSAAWAGGALLRARAGRRFGFEPVPGLERFRRIETGQVTAGVRDPFIGLGAPRRPPPPEIADAALCGALFRAPGPGVPVASFSDYYCPYCRVLTGELAALEREGLIAVTWHELPLLGEASETAALAALAAARQGGYPAFHARLMRSRFQPNDAYLAEIAGSAGLDARQLLADMRDPDLAAELRRSAALAGRFGFFGTPALVVGRTAVLGQIPLPRLRALIALEAEEGGGACPDAGG